MIVYTINKNEAEQRLDKYLKKLLKNAPDSFIYKMLRKKNIVLNGKKCDGKEKLSVGDEVKLFLSDETFEKFSSASKSVSNTDNSAEVNSYIDAYKRIGELQIIYENEHILVVNKPAGILSQKSTPADISINEWFIGYLLSCKEITKQSLMTFKPSICNRLDRNTSGMVVCGKSLAGSQYMSRIIKDKSLEKYYHCLVHGAAEIHERQSCYLYKDSNTNKVTLYPTLDSVPAPKRKEATFIDTAFNTIKTENNISLIEVQLFTGKTHQIRSHLASIGHPIIGDRKYGQASVNDKYLPLGVKNQLLHAYCLKFPKNDEPRFSDMSELVLKCDEPPVFSKLLFDRKQNTLIGD